MKRPPGGIIPSENLIVRASADTVMVEKISDKPTLPSPFASAQNAATLDVTANPPSPQDAQNCGRQRVARPIVAVGCNSERFDGYNLALRLVALGYKNVYWYRGGREGGR